ncbi:uncharacterized protein LOC101855098 [Aplysia californica]|uniref:Uncharacterized protein LOC101855098 n=1 Tax=Aplysia californica TaxID=6500 RepID=A0ABM0JN28_APLCA|nr:uncharacterized protein LOC101855098 [Aplysia californica]
MSGNYYKVTPSPPKVEGYGFRKVTQEELVDIVSRLTKPTYNSRIESDESNKAHNFRYAKSAPPPHSPSYCSRRFSVNSQAGRMLHDKKLSEHELQRLIRRIRRPTKAYQLSRKDYETDDELSIPHSRRPSTAAPSRRNNMSASERKKAFSQLSRPTTASRGKSVVECHLCTEEDKELNHTLLPFDYPYADDRSVTIEEVGSIITRVSSRTQASEKGATPCWKAPPDYRRLRIQSEHLPLVSGLGRSKSVAQIVARLHSSKGNSRRQHGCTPQATAVTDFCV